MAPANQQLGRTPAQLLRHGSNASAAAAATFAAFVVSGLAFASWAARIPQIRDQLGLDPATLGLVLMSAPAGCVTALPLSGPVVARFGSGRTVAAAAVLFGAGMAVVAAGTTAGVTPVVVGLVVLGVATAAWDVAMNLQGAVLERHLGRSMMSRLHAGFSVGTVVGALTGTVMVAVRIPVPAHLAAVAVLVPVAVPIAARRFLVDRKPDVPAARTGRAFAAWAERRTVLIGLFVLAFTFAEGAGMDWIGLAAIDGHRAAAWAGTLAFAAFRAAMTAGRFFGPGLLDRYGRVRVVRVLTVTASAGTVLFVFAPAAPLVFLGALLWGLGISLGFPVGVSAAGDDPEFAAGRVGVISAIGYCAFLAGPPTIGLLGSHVTVLRAVLAVAVLLAVAAGCGGIVAPRTRHPS
jgi:MFS family permease